MVEYQARQVGNIWTIIAVREGHENPLFRIPSFWRHSEDIAVKMAKYLNENKENLELPLII